MKEFKRTLSIDIETYSSVSLPDCGVYPYVEAPDFEILLFGFCFDDEPVKVLDLTKKSLPDDIVQAIKDENILKTAYNANFERVCLSKYIGERLSPKSWECTMVKALMAGLPGPLGKAAIALGFEEDKQKDRAGKALIRYFSLPCKPTKANGRRTRNLPEHAPDKWDTFISYCGQDVVVEREIRKALSIYKQPEIEHEYWCIDQDINDRGIGLDIELIEAAILVDENLKERSFNEISRITGVDNPNSRAQIKDWVEKSLHIELEKFDKEAISDLVKTLPDGDVKKVLKLRQITTKTSVKKYNKMLDYKCEDLRARGTMQFYGANRTGRFAGRGVQLQNLSKNIVPDLHEARDVVKSKDLDYVELMFGNVSDILSQLVRTAFIPSHGNRFIVSDFSAIEARVIAWVAGEQWRLDVFKDGGDIYCDSASQMFGVPVVKHGINGELRQKGKIAELACIAKGSLVDTLEQGLIPIEDVYSGCHVFDGEEYVKCDGAICRGVKGVITYDGLTATEDHLVWVEGKSRPISFGESAASGERLYRPKPCRKDLRVCKNNKPRKTVRGDIKGRGKSGTGEKKELERYREKVEVYDLLNCGPRHRFTANGVLVHNCGYGGGVGALKAFGADKMGLSEEEMQSIVKMWRAASPNIVKLWWDVDAAAHRTLRTGRVTALQYGIKFGRKNGNLLLRLPSGRKLVYQNARIEENLKFGKPGIAYDGIQQQTHNWGRIDTYGPKIVENLTQGIARDCLCIAMKRLTDDGFKIVSHVHDEVILDVPRGFSSHEEVSEIMGKPIQWAPGLLLNADGYECDFYMKD